MFVFCLLLDDELEIEPTNSIVASQSQTRLQDESQEGRKVEGYSINILN